MNRGKGRGRTTENDKVRLEFGLVPGCFCFILNLNDFLFNNKCNLSKAFIQSKVANFVCWY